MSYTRWILSAIVGTFTVGAAKTAMPCSPLPLAPAQFYPFNGATNQPTNLSFSFAYPNPIGLSQLELVLTSTDGRGFKGSLMRSGRVPGRFVFKPDAELPANTQFEVDMSWPHDHQYGWSESFMFETGENESIEIPSKPSNLRVTSAEFKEGDTDSCGPFADFWRVMLAWDGPENIVGETYYSVKVGTHVSTNIPYRWNGETQSASKKELLHLDPGVEVEIEVCAHNSVGSSQCSKLSYQPPDEIGGCRCLPLQQGSANATLFILLSLFIFFLLRRSSGLLRAPRW